MPRPTLAGHEIRLDQQEARLDSLEGAKLSDKELLTLRVLLRAETARLQRRADWAGPLRLWRALTVRQRWTAVLIALAALITLINQVASLLARAQSTLHH